MDEEKQNILMQVVSSLARAARPQESRDLAEYILTELPNEISYAKEMEDIIKITKDLSDSALKAHYALNKFYNHFSKHETKIRNHMDLNSILYKGRKQQASLESIIQYLKRFESSISAIKTPIRTQGRKNIVGFNVAFFLAYSYYTFFKILPTTYNGKQKETKELLEDNIRKTDFDKLCGAVAVAYKISISYHMRQKAIEELDVFLLVEKK